MSGYPYTGQLAPAVGGGLGGLPRRGAKGADGGLVGYGGVLDEKLLPELVANNRWRGPNYSAPSGDGQGYNYAAVDVGDYILFSLKISTAKVRTYVHKKKVDMYGTQTVDGVVSSKDFGDATAIYGPALGKISDSAVLHTYSEVGVNTINAKVVGVNSAGTLSDLTNIASVNGGNVIRPIKTFKIDDDSWVLVCMDSGGLHYYLISGITIGTLAIVAMASTGSDPSFSESYNANGRITIKQLTPSKYIVATGTANGCWMQAVTISGSSVTKGTVYQVVGAQSGGIIPNPHVWVLSANKILVAYSRYTTTQGVALRTFDVLDSTVSPISAEVFYPTIPEFPSPNRNGVSFVAGDVFCIFGVIGNGKGLSALIRVNSNYVPRLVGGKISYIPAPMEGAYPFDKFLPFSDSENNSSGKINFLGGYSSAVDTFNPFTFSLGVLP